MKRKFFSRFQVTRIFLKVFMFSTLRSDCRCNETFIDRLLVGVSRLYQSEPLEVELFDCCFESLKDKCHLNVIQPWNYLTTFISKRNVSFYLKDS